MWVRRSYISGKQVARWGYGIAILWDDRLISVGEALLHQWKDRLLSVGEVLQH